jgi:MoaA/NifB/PqqE/SkfB family radical SAM enzyme
MKELIGIETSNNGMVAELDLTYMCNYNCSYCFDYQHTGKTALDADKVKMFIDKINPSDVVFPGGEPTLYPNIIDLIKYIKENHNSSITVVTNGFKGPEWWRKHHHIVDMLVFSFHIEHADVDRFIDTILAVCSERFVTVNIPMIPERFDELYEIGKRINETCEETYVSLKAIVKNRDILNYTEEQKKLMSTLLYAKDPKFTNPHRTTVYKVYSDGSREKTIAQELIGKVENNFRGWRCWKGVQFMKLLATGDVYKGICEQTMGIKPLGNIYDFENIRWPTEPDVCTKDRCTCIGMLKCIKKEKI